MMMTLSPIADQPRGRAVQLDCAAARRSFDHIGFEAIAVVDVDDLDALVLPDAGCLRADLCRS
jgi:hypothetical protein